MENYIDNDLFEICRTCLSKCKQLLPLSAIIDEENHNVRDYLKKYVQLEYIEDKHPMPEYICLKCFDRLLEIRNYYIQCQESEKYLKLKVVSIQQTKIPNSEYKIHTLHDDKNDTNLYENIEILDETAFLDFQNNGKCEGIEYDDDLNGEIKSFADKFEDLEETECRTEQSQNIDIRSEILDIKSENLDSSEDLDGKLKEFNQKALQNTIIKCVGCYCRFDRELEFNSHDCIMQQPQELYNVEATEDSLGKKISSNCRHRCEYCECSFVLLGSLQRHIAMSHANLELEMSGKNELNNIKLACLFCEKPSLKNRIRTYKKKKQQFVCTQCGKLYNNAQSMKEHEYAHKGIKPYKCEYCGREFAHECVRRAHLKLHTGKDIICPVCNKAFAAQSQLRIHMTYHTNDLKFPCDMCPKRFRRNHVLQLHRKTHTGRKTEQCEYCDSCFYTKDDLRGHTNSVHLKRYHCNLCKNRYAEPGRMRNHFLKVHNIIIEDVSSYKKKINELEILMTTRTRK